MPRLAAFNTAHPGIELHTLASEGLSDLGRDGVNIAIRQGKVPDKAALHHHQLAPLDLVAVAAPALAAPLSHPRSIADFKPLPLIEDGHTHWQLAFSRAGLSAPDPALSFNQTALALDAAAQGQGIALAPRILARDAIASGSLIGLWHMESVLGIGFHVLWPGTTDTRPATKTVIDWLLSQT